MRRDDNQAALRAIEPFAANDGATAPPPAATYCVEVGQTSNGPTLIDIGRLLTTRLLVTAGSGGGKSWLMRRLVEQTHGKVQQIVIDPEGELVTLAEGFDFVVCAPDSDIAPIGPTGGASTARAIYLSGRSAIISLSEFDGLEEMHKFVADFCRELLLMPPETWHHVLLVFDEAQIFAPQNDKAESKKALIDLARRGRKRGMCPVFATPRVSELAKGVVGHLENKLVGLTTLDLDIARAADMLGIRVPAARQLLSRLPGGHFIAFGPALGYDLVETKVGPVQTRHGLLSAYNGVAAAPTLSRDELAAQLRSFHQRTAAVDDDDPGDAGLRQTGSSRAERSRSQEATGRRPRLSPQARIERAFEVAQEIVDGADASAVARRRGVTDHAVRTWLHEALSGVNLQRLGIRGQRVRARALQERAGPVTAALGRAKARAEKDLRRRLREAQRMDWSA